MSISFVAATAYTSGSSSANSHALSYPTGIQANDLLVLQLEVGNGGVSITTPSGWTLIRTDQGNSRTVGLYRRVASGSESGTVAVAISSSYPAAGGMACYRGVNPSAPIDAHAGQVGGSSSTTATAPSVSASAAGGRLLTFVTLQGNASVTPASGQTERWDSATSAGTNNCTSQLADEALSGSGATGTRTASLPSSYLSITQSVILAAAPSGAWTNWTERDGQIAQRVGRITLAASGGSGYIGLSLDGTTWTWYSGPLAADGHTLTSVASESAAQSAAVALPGDGYWDIPDIVEARYVRLQHQHSAGYTIYEFYPRRLVEADDVRAEAIRAIHIKANEITGDKLSAVAIDGMTITGATIRTAASGQRVVMDATGLTTYDASNTKQVEASTATNGRLTIGDNLASLGADGVAITTISDLGLDELHALQFKRPDGTVQSTISGVTPLIGTESSVRVRVFPKVGETSAIRLLATAYVSGGLNVGTATGAGTGAIKTSGNADIGSASPAVAVRLAVKSASADSSTFAIAAYNSSNINAFNIRSDGAGYLAAASWTYGSDARLKRNIAKYDKRKATLAQLKRLEIEQFDYIDGATNQVGYVADALETVIPDAVTVGPDGMRAVRSLEPWIVLWLQELAARDEARQQQITTQQQQIDALQQAVTTLQTELAALKKAKLP